MKTNEVQKPEGKNSSDFTITPYYFKVTLNHVNANGERCDDVIIKRYLKLSYFNLEKIDAFALKQALDECVDIINKQLKENTSLYLHRYGNQILNFLEKDENGVYWQTAVNFGNSEYLEKAMAERDKDVCYLTFSFVANENTVISRTWDLKDYPKVLTDTQGVIDLCNNNLRVYKESEKPLEHFYYLTTVQGDYYVYLDEVTGEEFTSNCILTNPEYYKYTYKRRLYNGDVLNETFYHDSDIFSRRKDRDEFSFFINSPGEVFDVKLERKGTYQATGKKFTRYKGDLCSRIAYKLQNACYCEPTALPEGPKIAFSAAVPDAVKEWRRYLYQKKNKE